MTALIVGAVFATGAAAAGGTAYLGNRPAIRPAEEQDVGLVRDI